jgi:hypothetical protein
MDRDRDGRHADRVDLLQGGCRPGTPKVLEPGQVNTEDAARAVRRIRDYLARHPGDSDVDVASELADEDPLILPRAVVVMLASMLAQLPEGGATGTVNVCHPVL